MNNFVNRFYFFSKLTTSFILFLLLILLSYLFVKAYLKEKDLNSNNIEFSKLSDKISNLTNIIDQNSNNLNDVRSFVQENKQSVNDIIVNLENLNDNKINNDLSLQIEKLFEENKKLKNELYNISTNNLENSNKTIIHDEKLHSSINIIIKLIRLKLNNGSNFNEEVELLNDLELKEERSSNVEKLSIYATRNFPGINKLESKLDQISSQYLNAYYIKKNNIKFIKYFINLVKIQPNLNNNVENENVLLLSLAKQDFLDKNLDETIKRLNTLDDGEYYFSAWIEHAIYYEKVTDLLNKF